MANEKPAGNDKPTGDGKPPKRDKPTKVKVKTHIKRFWLATTVDTTLDKHAKVVPGLLELHKVTLEEWKAAGGNEREAV